MPFRFCLLLCLLLPLQVFAQSAGQITFAEGKLRVIRDAALLVGAQGLAVEAADIIETPKRGSALIEFPDGVVIALGEVTRVMLARDALSGKSGPELLLLEGWMKVQARLPYSATSYGVSTPLQSVGVKNANLVIHGNSSGGEIFVESGAAMIGMTDKHGRPLNLAIVKSGQFVTRVPDKLPVAASRPNDVFLEALPSAFKDSLPVRLERFKDRKVTAKVSGAVSYADVGDWLSAPSSWRAGFVKRFEPRLADPAFRLQTEMHLKSHPEWEKALGALEVQVGLSAHSSLSSHSSPSSQP